MYLLQEKKLNYFIDNIYVGIYEMFGCMKFCVYI